MRTGRSLGNLADVVGSRTPEPTEHIAPEQRITELERRVATIEGLLNDVMQQLDKPHRDQHTQRNGHNKQAKPNRNGKPKQAKPAKLQPLSPEEKAHMSEQKREADAEAQKVIPRLKELLADGNTTLTDKEVCEALEIGKRRWQRVRQLPDFATHITTIRTDDDKQAYCIKQS